MAVAAVSKFVLLRYLNFNREKQCWHGLNFVPIVWRAKKIVLLMRLHFPLKLSFVNRPKQLLVRQNQHNQEGSMRRLVGIMANII